MQELTFEQVSLVSGGSKIEEAERARAARAAREAAEKSLEETEGGSWGSLGSGDITCCTFPVFEMDAFTIHGANILNSFNESAAEWALMYQDKVVNNGSDHVGR